MANCGVVLLEPHLSPSDLQVFDRGWIRMEKVLFVLNKESLGHVVVDIKRLGDYAGQKLFCNPTAIDPTECAPTRLTTLPYSRAL